MRSSPLRRHRARRPWWAALVALCSCLTAATTASTARAQSSSAVTVSATVGTPVTLTADVPLDFTTVYAGTPKTVTPAAGGALGATAGHFTLWGKNNSEVLLMFALPSALAGGASTLPVDSWQGCHHELDTPAGCTAFVPSASGTVTRLANGGGAGQKPLYIFVGATVHPSAAQPAGAYAATLTLTAVYTGF